MSEPTRPAGPQITWPIAVVCVAFLTALVVVVLFGPGQTAVVVMVGMAILGGIGLNVVRTTEAKQEASAAKEQSNGNMSRVLAMVEGMANQLAAMQPAPDPGAAATADTSLPD